MDVTIITPFYDGVVDIDGDITDGIMLYKGKLTADQVAQIVTSGNADGQPATMVKRKPDGEIDFIEITFNFDYHDPVPVDPSAPYYANCEGFQHLEETPGYGAVRYVASYMKVNDLTA